MQLSPPPDPTALPTDVASGLRQATRVLGFGPAVTVLRPERREEQGVATLAQWTAKGAHLLGTELGLGPDDRVHVDIPAGWPLAAVCLALWWAGVAVTLDGDAEVAVVDEGRTPPAGASDVLWTGAAIDGAPIHPVPGEPWAQAVQTFPDAPPPPGARADLPALLASDRRLTQRELLATAAALGDPTRTLGIDADAIDPVTAVLAVAARPIGASRPTVVLAGTGRDAAHADRVGAWLPPAEAP